MKKKKIALGKLSLRKDVITLLNDTQAGAVKGGSLDTQVLDPSRCVLCYTETQNHQQCNNTQVLDPSRCVLCYPETHRTQAPC